MLIDHPRLYPIEEIEVVSITSFDNNATLIQMLTGL
jgi:hypothetical protein